MHSKKLVIQDQRRSHPVILGAAELPGFHGSLGIRVDIFRIESNKTMVSASAADDDQSIGSNGRGRIKSQFTIAAARISQSSVPSFKFTAYIKEPSAR